MSEPSAYFLIAHGSRDPRSRQALEACATLVRQQLADHSSLAQAWPFVGAGVLEGGEAPLSVQMATFANTAARNSIHRIFLMPLFLMSGNHVNDDLPAAVSLAQDTLSQLNCSVDLVLCPHLGSHPQIAALVRSQREGLMCDHWVMLAHGTRRPGGNAAFEALAVQLNAMPAYWAMEPTLEMQLRTLTPDTPQTVGVMPYFLCAGSIVDAICTEVDRLG
ncbi:MAG: CbiX/SirB N-terminal domain-containing protein, partial [Thermosynechococcaceae cyanobacterium]